MLYLMVPASLLIINLIINWDYLRKYGFRINDHDKNTRVPVRYNYFIMAANIYFFVDATWGIMYEHHDIPALFPFIYSFTVFYFLFMLMTMLTWTPQYRTSLRRVDNGGDRCFVPDDKQVLSLYVFIQ